VQVEHDRTVLWKRKYTAQERDTLKRAALRIFRDDVPHANFGLLKLVDRSTVNKDATRFGTTLWPNDAVTQLLARYGLPPDSPLSVLCVETLPHISNIFDHVTVLDRRDVRDRMRAMVGAAQDLSEGVVVQALEARTAALRSLRFDQDRPLSDQLGQYRILRTSPLTRVPYVCAPVP
jgi:hypothetical protein